MNAQMSPELVREAHNLVVKILDKRGFDTLEEITDRSMKDEVREEINSALSSLEAKGTVVKKSSDTGRPTLFETILEKYQRKDPSNKYRMCNTNSAVQSMWKSKGFSVVTDDKGNMEKDGDLILMSCPMDTYIENVRQPIREKKASRRKAAQDTETRFKEEAARAGVETFGGIKFDQRKEA